MVEWVGVCSTGWMWRRHFNDDTACQGIMQFPFRPLMMLVLGGHRIRPPSADANIPGQIQTVVT
jgi:hypothetical protein